MIQIYCGDGKGKTSAAVGAVVRAAGHGVPVVFAQFLKDDTSGEIEILRNIPGVAVLHTTHHFGFFKSMSDKERAITRAEAAELLQQVETTYARAVKKHPDADAKIRCLIVLDEVMAAMNLGILEEQDVLQFVDSLDEETEVILTGRDPSDAWMKRADYVSKIEAIKHPYEKGIVARCGVER